MLRAKRHPRLTISSNMDSHSFQEVHTLLYPMRFLGYTKLVAFPSHQRICFLLDERAEDAVRAIRSGDHYEKALTLGLIKLILTEVGMDDHESKFSKFCTKTLSRLIMTTARLAGSTDDDTGNECYDADRKFTNTIKYAVQELRAMLETNDISTLRREVQDNVYWLLRLDVQLRVTPTAGRCESLPKNFRLLSVQEKAKEMEAEHKDSIVVGVSKRVAFVRSPGRSVGTEG